MSPQKLVLILAGLVALPLAAGAATPTDVPVVRVQFADLDLSHDAGVDHLYARLRQAAESVCDTRANIRDLRATAAEARCTNAALSRAVADIHSSRLSARHALGTTAPSVAMRD